MKITTACNNATCFRAFLLGLSLTCVDLDRSKNIVFPTVVKPARLRRLAVYFHCFLPVEVKLFLALYSHAISVPVDWFKVKFCLIYFKNASTLP